MPLLLEVTDLTYSHPNGTLALKGMNLKMSTDENLVLLGPNGSGKTTLLLHLNGTLTGQKGCISIGGLVLETKNLPEIRRSVGIVFQDANEQLFMPTVREDVEFGPRNLGLAEAEVQQRSALALSQVGIGSELFLRQPYHLSAGEKRRVALAGVLAMHPSLLLLDEPTTSLDPHGQRSLLALLKALPQPKLIATHDLQFARELSRRAIFMDGGQVIGDGPIDEIAQRFGWDPYR